MKSSVVLIGLLFLAFACSPSPSHPSGKLPLQEGEIQHMVIFSLSYEEDGDRVAAFLADGRRILSAIPGCSCFRPFDQVSAKNDTTTDSA
ncbi:MAG: hypothetical protein R2751_07760 [Bacteroidales bacterium]